MIGSKPSDGSHRSPGSLYNKSVRSQASRSQMGSIAPGGAAETDDVLELQFLIFASAYELSPLLPSTSSYLISMGMCLCFYSGLVL